MVLPDIKSFADPIVAQVWLVVKIWWWFFLTLLLYFPARQLYRWWAHWDIWYKEDNPWTMVEIIPPGEVKKPYRAMEDVYNALFWPLYDSPNWREVWCEGELENGPFWMSFEIASFGGDIHFYARLPKWFLKMFQSIIYAHYPDLEIIPADDYTQKVPQNLPNPDYRVYGEDYYLYRQDAYPITTYKFFEIRPEEVEEEKRLDALSSLLEGMAGLGKGEQLWFQMIINPITDREEPWVSEGRKLVEKLARREVPAEKQPSITGEAFRLLAFDKIPFDTTLEKKEESFLPPEMKLTPGERQILAAVEQKLSQNGFRTTVRSFYITDKDAYFSPNGKLVRAYFSHFSSQDLNTIAFIGKSRTKIHYFFRRRRLYTRKRKMFIRYSRRLPPFFPKRGSEGSMVLTAEELTTIFHLPIKAALLPTGVPRVAAKKGVPPPSIPIEE